MPEKTIEIRGVWLTKEPAHLGGQIEVLVELPDGTHKAAITGYACDHDGPISHYVHPGGIEAAPVREFTQEV